MIESFNDSVWPWRGLNNVDRVLAVGPAHVFEYPSAKFVNAVRMYDRYETGPRNITYQNIAEVVRPTKEFILRPIHGLHDEDIANLLVPN